MAAILDFFSLCWQMFTSSTWWVILFEGTSKLLLFKYTCWLPILSFVLSVILVLALYYAMMRSMHRTMWVRVPFIILASLFALLSGAVATLAVSACKADAVIENHIADWGKVMENPMCWSDTPAADFASRLEGGLLSGGVATERHENRTYIRLSPQSDSPGSLAVKNQEQFQAAAHALAGMVTDAFHADFPTLSPYVFFNEESIAMAFNPAAIWQLPRSSEMGKNPDGISYHKEGNTDIWQREYTAEELKPMIDEVTMQAAEDTRHISSNLIVFTSLLALLTMLPGLAIIFFDCDWQIRHT